jgi:transposase-like protein
MKLGIQLHLAGLSLADTVSVFASLDVERCRSTVPNWIQKADLQPTEGPNPNYVTVDETVIRVNDQRYSLFAAVDPDTNRLLHIRLFPTRNQALTEMFLAELREKHLVSDATFLVDTAP